MPLDPSSYVAPTAIVHPEAQIGAQCHIGEYCVIEQDVEIGDSCRLEPYVYVKRWTTMGSRNEVSAGTALGTDPLDKNFDGQRSYLRIGNGNRIREHYTVSRGTKPESVTTIGDDNYIMTSGHIAHNCVIGNRTVIASCALIAGYVEVQDNAFISGGVAVHQYSRIGRFSMVGGNSRVNKDIPPFFLTVGFHVEAIGANLVGMKRAGFRLDDVKAVKEAFRTLYMRGYSREEALRELETGADASGLTREIAAFVRGSARGICPARRASGTSASETEGPDG